MMRHWSGHFSVGSLYDEINDLPQFYSMPSRQDDTFWEFPKDRITILRKLGEGSFGSVNKANILPLHSMTLIKGGIVAVKTLKGKLYM
jgi:hypothetical protein